MMQSIKGTILKHVRVQASQKTWLFTQNENLLSSYARRFCNVVDNRADQTLDRVIGLVKKFDKSDASKVTETANFQKDLCLDSLDRTELVMAFEEEFSIEIPDDEADKLTCCAEVAKYILNANKDTAAEKS